MLPNEVAPIQNLKDVKDDTDNLKTTTGNELSYD